MLPPTVQATPPSRQPVPASSSGVPPALAELPEGALIRGTVVGRDAAGHVLLRTDAGMLALATRLELPQGSVVTLRVQPGPEFTATVESVDGRVPAPPGPVSTAAPAAPPPADAAPRQADAALPAPVPPTAPAPGSFVTAIVVSPAADANDVLRGLQPPGSDTEALAVVAGSRLTLRIVASRLPTDAASPRPLASAQPGRTGEGGATDVLAAAAGARARPSAPVAPTAPPSPGTVTPGVAAPEGGPRATQAVPQPVPAAPRVGVATEPATPGQAFGSPAPTAFARATAAKTTAPLPPAAANAPGKPAVPSRATVAGSVATPAATTATVPADSIPAATTTASIPVATTTATSPPVNDPRVQTRVSTGRNASAARAAGRVTASTQAPASPTGTAPPAAGPASPAGTPGFVAPIDAFDAFGRPLVATPLGVLRLDLAAPLPAGSTLELGVVRLDPEPLAAPLPAPAADGAGRLLAFARDWPALRELVGALHEVNPAMAKQVVAHTVATPGAHFAHTALFFLSALRGGDLSGWLGRETLRALEDSGRDELVRRVAGDFARIARFADSRPGVDWQSLLIPFHDGESFRQLRFFMRRRQREDGEGDDDGTRFVVEVELSRIGELQLDGFLHRKRFDLILRSRDALSATVRRDIAAIFDDGLAIAALTGTLAFQVAEKFPVAPLDDIIAEERDGLLV